MIVRFYSLSKRENSTLRPSGSYTEYECFLKSDTSVINPEILIDFADQQNPQPHVSFNYAYIPDFGRYYFIADQRSVSGLLWEYSLTCDVLATYRSDIAAANLYLLRCSSIYDGSIVDTLYPVKVSNTVNVQTVTTPWIHDASENIDISQGCYILGIQTEPGGYGPNYGSVKYVALDQTNMERLITYLMDAGTLTSGQITINGLSNEAVKSVINPLQYITSCLWTPMLYTQIDTQDQAGLKIWSWTAASVHYKPMRQSPPYYIWNVTFTDIHKHPGATIRGSYLNTAPYTKQYASIPPFGVIELDTTLSAAQSQIVGSIIYDIVTGIGILEIRYGSAGSGALGVRLQSQIGVPIQLTQVYNDYINAVGGVAGGLMGAVGSAITGNIGGAIMNGISAVGSAINAMRPVVSSIGSNGSFADLRGQARLYTVCYDVPPEDLAHLGRPCCMHTVISALSAGSYCLAMDGDIPIAGTAGEQARVKQYLENGFYYE